MKRLIISTTFTLTIIALYQFIDINLFTIDFPRRTSAELFKGLRPTPEVDAQIFIFDIEYTHLDTVKTQLELLESLGPKIIGVNLCNIEDTSEVLDNFLRQSKRIITCDCNPGSDKGTSRITTSENEVTHFQTDKDSYFELLLSDKLNELKKRGNKQERINFRGVEMYSQSPLTDIKNIPPDFVKDKTILVGFLRDSLVTPMNYWYGESGITKGDMSDVQISANIISTITRNEFINEVNILFRVLIILIVSLVCTGLIRLARTRYNAINIILGLVILIILNALSSYIIVFAFSKNYYLELNEMTVVLIISAIVSIYWNTKEKQSTS